MADIKIAYATSVDFSSSLTLDSLANGSSRESASVDNASNKYIDVMVRVSVNVGTVSGNKQVLIMAWGSEDGTVLPDTVTGNNAGITLENPTVMRLIGIIPTPTSSKTYESQPMSIAAAFHGVMPRKWGIVVKNDTGASLAASGHSVSYTGTYLTVS